MLGDDEGTKKKKRDGDDDSALEYSDGNNEFDDAEKDKFNGDSDEQNVEFQEDIAADDPDSFNNDISESVDDGKSK